LIVKTFLHATLMIMGQNVSVKRSDRSIMLQIIAARTAQLLAGDRERGALAGHTVHCNGPAVFLNNPVGYREAQASAPCLRSLVTVIRRLRRRGRPLLQLTRSSLST
jgi:DNA helicase HerA-like ATPase